VRRPTLTLPWPHPTTSLAQPRATFLTHDTITSIAVQPSTHHATRTLTSEMRPYSKGVAWCCALRKGQAGHGGSAVSLHKNQLIPLSMEQSCSCETSQGCPHILRRPKIYYSVYTNSPLAPILSQIYPASNVRYYSRNTHFNVIQPSKSRSSKWVFPSGFSTETPHAFLFSQILATCLSHFTLLQLITRIIFGGE
jgi:hypothetical protein